MEVRPRAAQAATRTTVGAAEHFVQVLLQRNNNQVLLDPPVPPDLLWAKENELQVLSSPLRLTVGGEPPQGLKNQI